ncbi:PAS domain S-box protein [Roseospira visakhapatnamensis]|uniref:histidine kinase n=1 Tax=Roseospira visakhapatnamensis TaxID=390880 RepID=A0A7W6RE10_9PROT|nr:PAS domain S-box protein [Roseospira visakhapatnamensis]MBB4266738.1 PAS domain S-box-containing protein [Roseospira visakhapatnamensis]
MTTSLRDRLLARTRDVQPDARGPDSANILARPLRQRVLLPLTVVLVLLAIGFAAVLVADQRAALNDASVRVLQSVVGDIDMALRDQSETLSGLTTLIVRNPDMRAALAARDRDRLLADHAPVFADLKARHGITHFYFHGPDRVNLVRVHTPDRHGDRIDRYTTRTAAHAGREAAGIELGPLGTFTLRVVRPIHNDGALIGYIELGMEIEHILADVRQRADVELAVLIEKSFLDRAGWETGMEMLNRPADWDRFPGHALVYLTLPEFPRAWDDLVHHDHVLDRAVVGRGVHADRAWHLLSAPIHDASGTAVAHLFVIRDITAPMAAFLTRLAWVIMATVGLLGLLLIVLYAILRAADRAIRAQQADLASSEERLSLATRSAGIGVWDWDVRTDSLVWDARMFALYGINPDTFGGTRRAWARRLHPDDLDRVEEEIRQTLEEGLPFDTTFRALLPTGAVRHVRASARVIPGADGTPTRLIGINYDISDRIEAQHSRDALATVVENADNIVVVKDLDLRVVATNQAFADASGHARVEDLLGRTEAEIFNVDPETEPVRTAMEDDRRAQTLPRGQVIEREGPVVHPDGSVRHVLSRKYPIYDQNDGLLGSGTIAVDITERQRLETELATSERRFRDIVGTMSDWVWEMDIDGRITYCSGKARLILGHPPEALIGRHFRDFMAEESVPAFTEAFARAVAETSPIRDLETWTRTHDGDLVCLVSNCVPILDDEGHLLGFRGTNTDITRRKRMEDTLKLRDRALAAVVNGIVITKADGDMPVVFCNPAFERITGFTIDEAMGRNMSFLHRGDEDQPPLIELRALLKGGFADRDSFHGLLRNYRKDGGLFWNRLSVAPVRDHAGRITHLVGVQEDVSEHKAREIELQEAREQADRANRAKSEFLAKMSHELRTPLNAVIGFSDIMQRQLFGPLGASQYLEYVDYIHGSGEYLLALINDILDMSKIEAGRMTLNEARVVPAEVVAGVLDITLQSAERRGVSLGAEGLDKAPDLWADERAVKQMLVNLVSNAIKFTPRDGRVRITAERTPDAGLALVVADTGVGIAETELERVLEPFRQAQANKQAAEQGTGLGLALVRSMIELHGGSIVLASREQQGTTVTLRFPAARVRPRASAASDSDRLESVGS